MKLLKKMLCLTAVVLSATAGLALPGLVFLRCDRKITGRISTYAMDQVELKAASQILESLELVAGNYTIVQLNGGKNLNGRQAYEAALEGLRQFTEDLPAIGASLSSEVLHSFTGVYKAEPFLGVSEDRLVSAVIWECTLYSDRAYARVLVDDHSKMLLAFRLEFETDDAKESSEDAKNRADEQAQRLAAKAAEYYGLQTESVENADDDTDLYYGSMQTGAWKAADDGTDLYYGSMQTEVAMESDSGTSFDGQFSYLLQMKNQNGEPILLSAGFSVNQILFNSRAFLWGDLQFGDTGGKLYQYRTNTEN